MIRLCFFIALIMGCSISSMAQQNPNLLLTKVVDNHTVQLKWYGPDVYNSDAVNVYRKPVDAADSEWVKLNNQPIKMLDKVPNAAPNSKQMLFAETLKKGIDPASKSIFGLLMLLESFESENFARYLGVWFEDTTATNGQAYLYETRLVKSNGKEIEFATSTPVKVGNPLAFEPPHTIKADGVNGKVTFNWEVETTRYYGVNIYRSETRNGDFELINPQPILFSQIQKEDKTIGYPDVFYTDDSLEISKNYYYYLVARGFFSDSSLHSEILEVLVRDEIPPAPVRGLAFERPDKQALGIKLSWEKGVDADLAGYYVQRKVTGEWVTVSPMIPADQTNYADQPPRPNSYLYRIVTTDKAGNETPCEDIIVWVTDNTPPRQPQNLKTEGKEGAIILTWDANTESDIMGYYVYRTESGYRDREMLLLNADFIPKNVFIDSLPKIAKNTFVYRVAAIDSAWNIGPKSELSEASMPDVTAPITPFIRRGYRDGEAIRVEWLPNLDIDLAGYELYRSEAMDSSFQWVSMHPTGLLDTSVLYFMDSNLKAGMTYAYQLFALDLDGNKSGPSNIYKVTTNPPVAPVAPAPTLSLKYDKKQNSLKLKWKQEENEAINRMVIFRREGAGRFIPVSTTLVKQQEFTDSGLEPEKTYTYQLRTYYKDGNITLSEPIDIVVK